MNLCVSSTRGRAARGHDIVLLPAPPRTGRNSWGTRVCLAPDILDRPFTPSSLSTNPWRVYKVASAAGMASSSKVRYADGGVLTEAEPVRTVIDVHGQPAAGSIPDPGPLSTGNLSEKSPSRAGFRTISILGALSAISPKRYYAAGLRFEVDRDLGDPLRQR